VSSVVQLATLEAACYAGGRGFESRRSRLSVCPAKREWVLGDVCSANTTSGVIVQRR